MRLYLSRTIHQALLLWAIMHRKRLWIAHWTHQSRQFVGRSFYVSGGDHVSE